MWIASLRSRHSGALRVEIAEVVNKHARNGKGQRERVD
jgi:hypothetical protein